MSHNLQQKSLLSGVVRFITRNSASMTSGLLVGAVLGLAFSIVNHLVFRFGGKALAVINKYCGEFAEWPKRSTETIVVVLCVAAVFYVIRLGIFVRKFWLSWRAGLVSGIGFSCSLAAALTTAALNITGSLLSLFLLVPVLFVIVLLVRRDARIGEGEELLAEADPDSPISKSDEDILGRSSVVASVLRAVVNDRAPVIALTGTYGDGKTSVLNLLAKALEARKDVACVRFSTWLPMDEKTLV